MSKPNKKIIKLSTAKKRIAALNQIKSEINWSVEKIVWELRDQIFLIKTIKQKKHNLQKLHSATGIGDLNLLYDDVTIYIRNDLNNNFFPPLFLTVNNIKTLIEGLEIKLSTFNYFKKRKKLQKIEEEIKYWKKEFLSFADFIVEYEKIMSSALEENIFLNLSIWNTPLLKDIARVISNIIYTMPSTIGKSDQLIDKINKYLSELEKLSNKAVKEMQKFELKSITSIDYLTNRISRRLEDRNLILDRKTKVKKWKGTYFPTFVDYWDKNTLLIFSNLKDEIIKFQKWLHEKKDSEIEFSILKTHLYYELSQFREIIKYSIDYLALLYKKLVNDFNFYSCDKNQLRIFSKISKSLYETNDFFSENLQWFYYFASNLQKDVLNNDIIDDKQTLFELLENFYQLMELNLPKVETEYIEKNSGVYELLYANEDFDFDLVEKIKKEEIWNWINNFKDKYNTEESFKICDFNWNDTNTVEDLIDLSSVALLHNSQLSNPYPNFAIRTNSEPKIVDAQTTNLALFAVLTLHYLKNLPSIVANSVAFCTKVASFCYNSLISEENIIEEDDNLIEKKLEIINEVSNPEENILQISSI